MRTQGGRVVPSDSGRQKHRAENYNALSSLKVLKKICQTHVNILSAGIWLASACASDGGEPLTLTEVQAVMLDGSVTQIHAGGALRVPSGTRDVEIRFGTHQPAGDNLRVKYRLEGFDSDWQDLPAEMRAVVHFVDALGGEVGASQRLLTGTSRGWRGKVENSDFVLQTLDAVVPPRAERAYLEFVSGGANATLGIYAFQEVQFDLLAAEGQSRHSDFPMNKGVDLEEAFGVPAGWQRLGSKPEMSEVVALPGESKNYALALGDNHGLAYCSWRLASASWVPVQVGERVRVQWRNCFSIGATVPAVAKYRFLRPGAYRFQTLAVTPSGEPIGSAAEILLLVQAPLWQRPWTWLLCALGVVATVAAGVRGVTKRRMQQKFAELERQRALEHERARIAQDIHDDLGAGLAQIAMLSELAQMGATKDDARQALLDEIGTRARAIGRKFDEIVWAINPAHDSAEDLVGYLARFAQDYLSLAQIRFRLDVPPTLPEIGLTSRQRHQIFLAVKEAIHNAVKHGSAHEITMKARLADDHLVITVADDGCGFNDTDRIAALRGSASMKTRIEKLGGRFHREASPGDGTCVVFTLPLNNTAT